MSRTRTASRTATGALLAVAATGPVLYPLALGVAARRRPVPRPPAGDGAWPVLSVVVAAYLEADVIGAKVRSTEADGYPGELEVVVVADDPATAAAAREAGAVVVTSEVRSGKSAALGRGVSAARGEVVVFTDANTELEPGSLAALARWFADPAVGAVAGEKAVHGGGQGVYWRFESWLKRHEDRLGGTVGLVGEVAAVRRSAWRDVPATAALDDLWIALDVLGQGLRVAYEPQARAYEDAPDTLAEEWERRTRNVAGLLHVLSSRREALLRADAVSAQLWGHRLVRVSAGPVAHGVLVLLSAGRVLQRRPGRAPAA
ncbi:MAG: glycosyl transferase family 2, partial [Frankiales bacterium]|nr:glycosyl transferase family 2 [Frankiales bacterium]